MATPAGGSTTDGDKASAKSNGTRKAVTPSRRGVVDRGRLEPRSNGASNGTGNRPTNRDLAATSSTPQGDWWRDAGDVSRISERDRKRMSAAAHAMGEQYHSLADSLYRPDLASDADRPTGRTRVPDERLYPGNGRQAKPATARATTTNTRHGNGASARAKSPQTQSPQTQRRGVK
jgi:hypothetical protein